MLGVLTAKKGTMEFGAWCKPLGNRGMREIHSCARVAEKTAKKSVCPFNGFKCEYVVCCDAVFELWLIRNRVVSYDPDKMSCFRDLRSRA